MTKESNKRSAVIQKSGSDNICENCGERWREHYSHIGWRKEESYCNPNMKGKQFKPRKEGEE